MLVLHDHVVLFGGLNDIVGLVDSVDDPPCDLPQPVQLSQARHPVVGRLPVTEMRRLVARRSAKPHDRDVLAVFLLEHFAGRAPVVGGKQAIAFHLLRRAGNVDDDRQQFVAGVPEEHRVDVMILHPFDGAEIGDAGRPVHDGRAIGVDGPAVVGDNGMAQAV